MKIYTRKDGRNYAVVENPKGLDGKRSRKYIYGETIDEIENKVIAYKYETKNNIYVDKDKTPLGAFLFNWIEIHKINIAETTYELYKMYINVHINPLLGELKICDIMPMHIQQFFKDKLDGKGGRKKLSVNSVSKLFLLLNKAFSVAVKNRIIKYNPCEGVDKPKKTKPQIKIYNEEQVFKLLDITKGTFDEIAILLGAFVGLRRGEMFGLRWCDIDYDNSTLSIHETLVRFNKWVEKEPKNTSSQRTICVPDFVIDVLKQYRKTCPGSKRVCEKFKPGSYSEHFKNLLIKHGLPHTTLHGLRHFNFTIMMAYGVPDKIASKHGGHAQVSTTRETYQHTSLIYDKQVSNVMQSVYKKRFS